MDVDGDAAQVLPSLSQVSSLITTTFGDAAQTLTSLNQNASGAVGVDGVVGVGVVCSGCPPGPIAR